MDILIAVDGTFVNRTFPIINEGSSPSSFIYSPRPVLVSPLIIVIVNLFPPDVKYLHSLYLNTTQN